MSTKVTAVVTFEVPDEYLTARNRRTLVVGLRETAEQYVGSDGPRPKVLITDDRYRTNEVPAEVRLTQLVDGLKDLAAYHHSRDEDVEALALLNLIDQNT